MVRPLSLNNVEVTDRAGDPVPGGGAGLIIRERDGVMVATLYDRSSGTNVATATIVGVTDTIRGDARGNKWTVLGAAGEVWDVVRSKNGCQTCNGAP